MTDKQIIIHDVDVSGCTYSKIGIDKKYYCEQDLYDDGTPVFTCDECANCYYKQLKRKEQECERLDNEAQNLFTEKTNLEIESTQLKAENEELKEKIKFMEEYILTVEIARDELEREKALPDRYCRIQFLKLSGIYGWRTLRSLCRALPYRGVENGAGPPQISNRAAGNSRTLYRLRQLPVRLPGNAASYYCKSSKQTG